MIAATATAAAQCASAMSAASVVSEGGVIRKKWLSLAEGRPQKRSKAKRFCAPISREISFLVKLP